MACAGGGGGRVGGRGERAIKQRSMGGIVFERRVGMGRTAVGEHGSVCVPGSQTNGATLNAIRDMAYGIIHDTPFEKTCTKYTCCRNTCNHQQIYITPAPPATKQASCLPPMSNSVAPQVPHVPHAQQVGKSSLQYRMKTLTLKP